MHTFVLPPVEASDSLQLFPFWKIQWWMRSGVFLQRLCHGPHSTRQGRVSDLQPYSAAAAVLGVGVSDGLEAPHGWNAH
jgi:hypothetical protein